MRITAGIGIGIATVALAVGLSACSADSAEMTAEPQSQSQTSDQSSDQMSDQDGQSLMGSFAGLNDKKVAGDVVIEGDTVTLSGFSSDEGPDLHLYLTNGTDEDAVAAGMVLGAVAFDQESQTFMLDGVDPADYANIVVHCDKAKAVFGAAELS